MPAMPAKRRSTRTRRAEPAQPKRRAPASNRGAQDRGTTPAVGKVAAAALLIFDIYLIASLFTSWTGSVGDFACGVLTGTFGGAVVIPMAFIAYICLSIVTGRSVPRLGGTVAGAVLMFFCGSLLLGMAGIAYGTRPAFAIFDPGDVGRALAGAVFSAGGPLGTTLLGLACACLSLICFGVTGPFVAAFDRIAQLASSLTGRRYQLPRRERREEPATLDERTDVEGPSEPAEPEQPIDEPRLQTYDGKFFYVNETDEVIRERSQALIEQARAKSAEREAREQSEREQLEADEPTAAPEPEQTPAPAPTQTNRPLVSAQRRHDDGAPDLVLGPEDAARQRQLREEQRQAQREAMQERMIAQAPTPTQPAPEQTYEPVYRDAPASASSSEQQMARAFQMAHDALDASERTPMHEIEHEIEQGIEHETEQDITHETEGEPQQDELPTPVDVVRVDEVDYEPGRVRGGVFPPPLELIGPETDESDIITQEMARPWGERIIDTLAQFGIKAELAEVLIGPTVIQFRIQPHPGVKVSQIIALSNDMALSLAVASLRVEAPIPGKPYVGIEIPNPKRRGITLRSILEDESFTDTDRVLPLPMGVTINGESLVVGLEEMPHMLVAGTTGSGKSVFINCCIVGLCSKLTPDELRMILVDPKQVEMAIYEKLPHLLTPPVIDTKKAVHVLGWAVREMERRYSMCRTAKVRSIASYNEVALPKDRMPHIVIILDEFADLMMTGKKDSNDVEDYIVRIAQMARAVGIHLILATQRPSAQVVTGLIKANVPGRVAFTLAQMMDSRIILDTPGAEKLLGRGDMLFSYTKTPKPLRIQSPWIDESAIMKWLDYLVGVFGEPDFAEIESQGEGGGGMDDATFDDSLFEEAARLVVASGQASASGLQRRLRVGFARAGRLIDMLEQAGVISAASGTNAPREILVGEAALEEILEQIRG